MPAVKPYGELLRSARQFAKMSNSRLTTEHIAKQMGFSVGFLMHLETGIADPLPPARTVALCRILGVRKKVLRKVLERCVEERGSLNVKGLPEGLQSVVMEAVVNHYIEEAEG